MQTPHAPGIPVAIIGCGLIGASWAALCLAHGHDVTAWDPDAEVRDSFAQRLTGPMEQVRALDPSLTGTGTLRIAGTLEACVEGAELVQENAPESVPLKRGLYARIIAAAPSSALIASSTSSLTWEELGIGMADPERLVTAHPFNPPHLMPLVELFAASVQVRDRARQLYEGLGREVVVLNKPATGHIANRLASALWREAVNIVAEGIADVAEVDRALIHGPGLRWSAIGVHMGYHLGGGAGGIRHYLDHLGPSQERRWATLGTPGLTPEVCDLLTKGVEAATGGRDIPELERERDEKLIASLKARNARDN